MKTVIKNILICLVLPATAGRAFAYPPDNAAVLYYRAFMLLEEPNDEVGRMLNDLFKGNIGANEQIRGYVEENRRVIKYALAAAEIEQCDWGLDFSEGVALVMPQLSRCRRLAYLLAADAVVLTEKGDYKGAIERYVAIHKLSIHLGDDMLISYLVSTAINEIANKRIVDIISRMPANTETLSWLATKMTDVRSRQLSIEAVWAKETEMALREMEKIYALSEQMGGANQYDPNCGADDKLIEQLRRIQQGDKVFLEKCKENVAGHMAAMQAAFGLPYSEAHGELTRLVEKVIREAKEKPEAVLTSILCPAVPGIISVRARRETFFNAVEAAIEIYIIRAKTGTLPDEMPAGLPKDLFSGKDFLYEKTDIGFILKCQGKDLDKKIVHQYEFKVVK